MISRPEIQAFLGTYQEGAEKFPVHLQLHPGIDPSSIFLTGSSGSGKSTAGQCHTSGDCEYIDCGAITLRDQSLFFNCGYVSPPLNAQYEVVQPDLHSLERYDFSKEPDLPWYP